MSNLISLLFTIILLTLTSACATKSAFVEESLIEPAKAGKQTAKHIRQDLERSASIQFKTKSGFKSHGLQSLQQPEEEMVTINTGTSIELYPITPAYAHVYTNEKIEEQAFKERWDDKKKKAEHDKFLNGLLKSASKDKQCFNGFVFTSDSGVIGTTPDELSVKYWAADLIQSDKKTKVDINILSKCLTETRKTVNTRTGYTTQRRTWSCPTIYCAKTGVDFSKEVSLVIDARIRKGTIPVTLTWKGYESD